MSHLGEIDSFKSLQAGIVLLDVPVVGEVVQMHYSGPKSRLKNGRLTVDIQRDPTAPCPESISVEREDGADLQVCSRFETVENNQYVTTSLTLFEAPIPEITFVLSSAGFWVTREKLITEENKNHLAGFASRVGLYAFGTQHRRRY